MPMDDGPTGSLAEVLVLGLPAPPLPAGRGSEVIGLALAHVQACTLEDARMSTGTDLAGEYSYGSVRLVICTSQSFSSRASLNTDSVPLAPIMRAPTQPLAKALLSGSSLQLDAPWEPIQSRLLLEHPTQDTNGASDMNEVSSHAKHLNCC
jgi:hypothetical protein